MRTCVPAALHTVHAHLQTTPPRQQVAVCKEQVEWAIAEKRTFLRQRIQLRLASLYLDTAEYQDALKIVGT
jgi:predicted negative regulator of RcsB-dependent stress response